MSERTMMLTIRITFFVNHIYRCLLFLGLCLSACSALFKASRCYDVSGNAHLQLRCPPDHRIHPVTTFTGISRSNACSYQAWDCVIQEGFSKVCEDKHMCTVSTGYHDSHRKAFFCGKKGTTIYFQVEYECHNKNGSVARVTEPPVLSTTTENTSHLNASDVLPDVEADIYNDTYSIYEESVKPTTPTPQGQFAIIAIVCGATVALILVVVATVTLTCRVKNRTYERTPSLYGPIGGSGSSIQGRESRYHSPNREAPSQSHRSDAIYNRGSLNYSDRP